MNNRFVTALIAFAAILALLAALTFAIGVFGFVMIAFIFLLGVLSVFSVFWLIAVRIFGRAKVDAWLARLGIEFELGDADPEHTNSHRGPDNGSHRQIEDAVVLDETPGPDRGK